MVAAADVIPLVDLEGVQVTLLGVGRVAGAEQPPTVFVEAIRGHVQRLCERTGAECVVLTSGGRS